LFIHTVSGYPPFITPMYTICININHWNRMYWSMVIYKSVYIEIMVLYIMSIAIWRQFNFIYKILTYPKSYNWNKLHKIIMINFNQMLYNVSNYLLSILVLDHVYQLFLVFLKLCQTCKLQVIASHGLRGINVHVLRF
jgi:hypothetical protein